MAVRDPGYGRRHPLCPNCRYDLVVTIDEGRRTCPECGEEFDLDEVVPEVRPGDWTMGRGLVRAAFVLTLKSLVCFAVWGIILLVLALLPRAVEPFLAPLLRLLLAIVCGLLTIATGGAIGHVIAKGVDEHAGFSGWVLIVITILFAWTTIYAAATVINLTGGITDAEFVRIVPITGILAAGLAARAVVMEEY